MRRLTTSAIVSAVTGLLILWYAGGSGAQPPLAIGEDEDITEEGLHRVDPALMEAAWVKPDLDLTGYTRVLLMPTAVQFRDVRPVADNARGRIEATIFPLAEDRKEWLRSRWREAVEARFARQDSYDLFDGVEPNVLVVQAFLVDVISRIPPDSVGSVYTYVSDPWSATVVLEVRDAMSGEFVARTIDRRNAKGLLDVGEVWYQTEALLERWAEVAAERLNQISVLGGRSRSVPEWVQ